MLTCSPHSPRRLARSSMVDPYGLNAGFAIAVFGGALDCLLLLFRKSIAYYVFIASLLGTIVTMIHTIGVASSTVGFAPSEIFMMI